MTIETRVEILDSSHTQHLLEHFMGLSDVDRRFRFSSCMISTVEDYVRKLDFTRDKVFGAWTSSAILVGVGHLYFFENTKVAHICMSIDPGFRGFGYGQILLEHAKKITKAYNCIQLKITCSSFNTPMIRFANKNKFCRVACSDNEWEGVLQLSQD